MVKVTEAATGKTPLGAALEGGVENISYFQTITLTKYVRVALPSDGFVFWFKADILSGAALPNDFVSGYAYPSQGPSVSQAAVQFVAKGSLHYTTTITQEEEATSSTNEVVLTSQEALEELNSLGLDEIYIGIIDGVRFAFSARNMFYAQAGLWHYRGNALYTDMVTQIIDNPAQIGQIAQIVSNSLPIWLSMQRQPTVDWEPMPPPNFQIFPSYLLPLNKQPPYASVHVEPESTAAIAAAPLLGATYGHDQLSRDKVRVVLYGLNNYAAQNFLDYVLQFINNNPTVMGLMNSPVVRDLKRGQVEFQAIAQKKAIDFEVNYYQSIARQITRQTLQQVATTFLIAA